MSDYLYNILARTLGLVDTAQPLVTSLFEPPRDFKPVDVPQALAPAENYAPAQAAKDEKAELASVINQPRDAPAPATQAHTLNSSSSINASAAPDSRSRASSAKHAQEKGVSPLASLDQFLQQRKPEPAPRENQAPPAKPETSAPILQTGDQAQASAQTIRTHEPAPRESSNPGLMNADAASFAIKESRAEAKAVMNEPARKQVPLAAPITPLPPSVIENRIIERTLSRESVQQMASVEINNVTEQRAETIIVKPQVSRYVEMQQPEAARAAQAEQVVQVTIGRIEVRAATAPHALQTTPQTSRQRSSQSLEDYLRQRAQGGANR